MIINYSLSLMIILFLGVLIIGTGIHGDDLTEIMKMSSMSWGDFFNLDPNIHGHYVFGIPAHFTLFWAYKVFDFSQPIAFELLKIFFHYLSIFFVFRYFQQYCDEAKSLMIALIFVLIPIHDATTYWYMALVYIFPASVIMFASYLLNQDKLLHSTAFNLIGSTFFYTAVPFALGISSIYLYKKEFRKFFIFIAPSIIYIIYYLLMSLFFDGIERKIESELSIFSFLKNILGQIITLLDSTAGISFILKILAGLSYLNKFSIFVVLIFSFFIIKISSKSPRRIHSNKEIYLIGIFVIFFSIMVFALSDRYFHSTFNLGNRSLTYASLLFAIVLTKLMALNRAALVIVGSILFATTLGNSIYWKKSWTHQSQIINEIQSNQEIISLPENTILIVFDNGYIKQNMFENTEFLRMPWNLRAIFSMHEQVTPVFASSDLKIESELIIDTKFSEKTKITENIFLYFSDENEIHKASIEQLSFYLRGLVPPKRHWLQTLDNQNVENIILKVSPRLEYLFRDE